jgi:hypothetical protein
MLDRITIVLILAGISIMLLSTVILSALLAVVLR